MTLPERYTCIGADNAECGDLALPGFDHCAKHLDIYLRMLEDENEILRKRELTLLHALKRTED